MTRVEISETILRWALERSGNPTAVEEKIPKLSEWLSGESRPTLRQLEKLARATSTPLGFLFLAEPPEERLSIRHFRTLGDEPMQRPSPDLLESVQSMERRQAWMREYLIEQGQEPLAFIGSAQVSVEAEPLAREMRSMLGLAEGWTAQQPSWTHALRQLQRKMDDLGILVVVNGIVGNNTHRKLDVSEFRGFVLVDEYAPLVFVNGADGKAAQMFTLAHELAHVWFGSSAAFDLRQLQPADDDTERACNRVAAEFLVPAADLHSIWPSVGKGPDRFQAIARRFKVSVLVAARRALDLTLISKSEFLDFYDNYQQAERRVTPSDGGDFYASQNLRVGRRFAEAVLHAVREAKLLYREAYHLTGLYGTSFERYAESIGFGEL